MKLLEVAANPKHKIILSLSYGMRLWVSKVYRLKLMDIDSDSERMQVSIEAEKRN